MPKTKIKLYYKVTGRIGGVSYQLGYTDHKTDNRKYYMSQGWKKSQLHYKKMGVTKITVCKKAKRKKKR